jgi:hypothetical protein
MATKLILAAISGLLFAGHALAEISASPQKLNAILCNTEEQAMALAASVSAGRTEPMAIDGVNKAAGTQVCGRYIGYAVVEIEKTENRDGALFMLAGVRFTEDGRLAWTASWVTPFNATGLARGT